MKKQFFSGFESKLKTYIPAKIVNPQSWITNEPLVQNAQKGEEMTKAPFYWNDELNGSISH